ncbi:unnamed protein product, partial [Meganyctiphanes norvegica]
FHNSVCEILIQCSDFWTIEWENQTKCLDLTHLNGKSGLLVWIWQTCEIRNFGKSRQGVSPNHVRIFEVGVCMYMYITMSKKIFLIKSLPTQLILFKKYADNKHFLFGVDQKIFYLLVCL